MRSRLLILLALALALPAAADVRTATYTTSQGTIMAETVSATSVSVGSNPTPITNVKVYSQTITPAQMAATAGAFEQNFTVTGLATTDKVIVNPGLAPTQLCIFTGRARVSATNTLTLTFINMTAALCTPAAGTWNIVAFRS